MAGVITDLIDRVSDSSTGRPIIANLAAPGKSIGAASINLDAATNWTTSSAIHFSIYETTTVGSTVVKNPSTQTDWKGTLSGVAVSNLTLTGGTDRAYTAGAKVEITPTARYAKDLYDWAMVGHTQAGAHKAFTESDIVPTAALQDSAVTTAKIANGTITKTDINFTTAGGIWWEEIGRTVLTTAASGMTVNLSSSKKYMYIVAFLPTAGGTIGPNFRFNNDTGNNYSVRANINGGADATAASASGFNLGIATSVNAHKVEGIVQSSSTGTLAEMRSTFATSLSALAAPDRRTTIANWASAAPITRIDVYNNGGTGNFAIGAELIVLGHD